MHPCRVMGHPVDLATTTTEGTKAMTSTQAFEMALDLAITAPTEAKAEQATRLAEEIAMMLTPEEVAQVKAIFEEVA